MNDLTNSRRNLIKQVGLGIGLAVSGKLSAAAASQGVASAVVSSKRKQLLETDVLVVGGGPAGIGAALGAARTGAKTQVNVSKSRRV